VDHHLITTYHESDINSEKNQLQIQNLNHNSIIFKGLTLWNNVPSTLCNNNRFSSTCQKWSFSYC